MKIGAKLTGHAELKQTLNRLPSAVTEPHQRTALMKGAELIRSEASALAPRGKGEHIADNIVIDALTVSELDKNVEVPPGTEAVVQVGPKRGFFYGYFLEYGTSKMGAQPFMRPAVDTKSRPALAVALSHLWESILAVSGGRAPSAPGGFGGRNL
jgi:HK97 gp10 family phage protein